MEPHCPAAMPQPTLRVLAPLQCPVVRAEAQATVAAVEVQLRVQPFAVGVLVDGSVPPQFVTRRVFFERVAALLAEGTPLDESIVDFAVRHGRELQVHSASSAAEEALLELLERRDEAAFEPLALCDDEGNVELLDTRGFLAEILARPGAGETLDSARSRAERLVNLLGRLAGDMRARMNDLAGALLMLGSTKLDEEQRASLSNADETARSLARIVADLDDFVELESGHMALEEGSFDIVDVFDELVDAFGARARESGLELLVDVDPALPESIHGDGARLRHVLADLVDNALTHTRSGSVVVRARAHGGELVLEVVDTGVGMDAQTLRAALDPFANDTIGASGTTRSLVGLGLGLSIVQHLVAAFGGELACESSPGKGTSFRIRMPVAPPPASASQGRVLPGPGRRAQQKPPAAPAAEAPSEPAPVATSAPAKRPVGPVRQAATAASRPAGQSRRVERPFAGRRVLVVDDEPVARTFAARVLESAGCRVDSVSDGHVALTRLSEQRYDLVLMDVQMPLLSGIETTRRLRATSGPNAAVPVLGLSSSADRSTRDEAVAAGMRELLLKPIVAGELVREVHQFLDGQRSPREATWRVLVVDDQIVSRRLAEAVLATQGARVRHAADGHEALTALARETFDLVLLDLYMPRLGGIETLIELQRRGDTTPVVVLSGSESSEEHRRALELGARTFVKKPLDRDELIEACRASRAGRRTAA